MLEFNQEWITLQWAFIKDNGSFYCWGIDEPLMDIYSEIFKPMIKNQQATFRNLLTWDKGNGQGQLAEEFRSYPVADEKCLFIMAGVQGFNNNADNYYEGWEPIRLYLKTERDKLGWSNKIVADFFGFHPRMADHWFSDSQWSMPKKEQYELLQKESKNKAFNKEYE
ncbi:MAG: hypothetical protein GY815_02275, partial [Gammaproteobacteria bacterium]|nr:hypothetical protein [Gammaproteobacteria bacterium]